MSVRRLSWHLGLSVWILVSPAAIAGKVKAQVFETDLEQHFTAAKGSSVSIENLLGEIHVLPQPKGRDVRIRAHVVSEAADAAEARRLAEEVQLVRGNEDGTVTWSVTFPEAELFRMPKDGVARVYAKWLAPLVKRKMVSTRYQGREVEVGSARGATALSVVLTVEVPMDLNLTAYQHVGTLECNGVRGSVALQVKEGELHAGRMFGELRVTTEGASARVSNFNGDTLSVETGNGNIEVLGVRSDMVRIESARGAVHVDQVETVRLQASTESGKMILQGLEPESMEVSSGTGDLDLTTELKRTQDASIRSTSGNVTVRLGTFAPFQLEAKSTTGVVKGNGVNVEIDQLEKHSARLTRGSGGANLRVESESGRVVIQPL